MLHYNLGTIHFLVQHETQNQEEHNKPVANLNILYSYPFTLVNVTSVSALQSIVGADGAVGLSNLVTTSVLALAIVQALVMFPSARTVLSG